MATGNSGDKLSLQKRLAVFLNIDSEDDQDYVTDVLEQLIDIGEDIDDVTAYLTSFLGDSSDDNDSLRRFARDVRRFKLGEEIVDPIVDTATASDGKQSGQENEIQQHHLQQRQRKNNGEAEKNKQPTVSQVQKGVKSSPTAKAKQKQEGQKTLKPTKNIEDVQSSSKSDQSIMPQPSKSSNSNKATKQKQQSPPLPPQKLKKGKAKKVCGCYGNKHKPLTNCLHCGRISCEAEGYDYCPFCHILIEDFSKRVQHQSCSNSASSAAALALLHKERLLEFDRTAAARTKILDDQEDYFISSNSMWSTQAEQDDAKEKEEERRRKLHERQKQVLNINF